MIFRLVYLFIAILIDIGVVLYFMKDENREVIEAVILGTIIGLIWPLILSIVGLHALMDMIEQEEGDSID